MRILIDLVGVRRVVDVRAFPPQATLAALLDGVGAPREARTDDRLALDGVPVRATAELRELTILEGSVISHSVRPGARRFAGWNVSSSGGTHVGDIVAVPRERPLVVGRSPHADLVLSAESASWQHCTVELEDGGVRVRDAGSTNGTIIDGERVDGEGVHVAGETTVLIGGAVLSLRPRLDEPLAAAPGTLRNLTPSATAPFNRPPRPGRPASPPPLEPPSAKEIPEASTFNVITIAAPLVMAAVLVIVLRDLRFAMFALLSPLMAIGLYAEQRRRRSRNRREEDARFSRELVEFRARVADAAEEETVRRRETIPDPAVVMRRAMLPSTLLWQRRRDAPDFLSLHVGVGDVPWQPALEVAGAARLDERVAAVVEDTHLSAAPVLADLNDAGVVGIVGQRDGAVALARSLVVQAAVHCGPADLTIGVFCDEGREEEWSWAAWLPHTRQPGGAGERRWMSNVHATSTSMLRGLLEDVDALPTPTLLTVLDSDVLTEGRNAPARALLGLGRRQRVGAGRDADGTHRVSGIVIASAAERLPAACTTVIEVGSDAAASVHHPEALTRIEDVTIAGIGADRAEECARALAHFDDPELVVPGASLPSLVRLPELLGAEPVNAERIRELWRSPGISAPIGLSEKGPFSLDIVRDGPHGLVGGTTGSGKSEFLRSFVTGLAARNDPTTLNFILIDFKGGAAFAACERLPHTIGTISNLDEQLADRALRALEAEMQRRQRLFAAAGEDIDNLPAYLATGPSEPLPRLLLVIDEFAMLVKDFPDVLASLVSVGAVGRTLGVHMILATQRPAGVVNDDILANTNLRVALRVQSREDSANVIGVPDASGIGRTQTGRVFVKLGQDDITPVQTALVTGSAREAASAQVDVRDVGLFGESLPRRGEAPARSTAAVDLDLLIDAIVAANEDAGLAPPRQVWPEALGERVSLAGYAHTDDGLGPSSVVVGGVEEDVVHVALVDEPDLQRQSPAGWDLAQGNLLLLGIAGSGTTTTLASIALTLAAATVSADLDILCLDVGSRGLSALEGLPHTIAYVGSGPGEKEGQLRFLRHLDHEIRRRRETPGPHRRTIVLIDGLIELIEDPPAPDDTGIIASLARAYAGGPALGLHFAVSATRPTKVPSAMSDVTTQRWLYRLADVHEYSAFGVRGTLVPQALPGRCVDTLTLLQMHVATPDHGLEAAVAEATAQSIRAAAKPAVVRRLPSRVAADSVSARIEISPEILRLPVGIREDTLDPALLDVYDSEHVLITGPARSGKSTLLCAIVETLRSAPDEHRLVLWGIFGRRSPLAAADLDRRASTPAEIADLLDAVESEPRRVFVLIDDCERFAESTAITTMLSSSPRLTVIAAGRSVDLRAKYSWARDIAAFQCGVLLRPDHWQDGGLFGGIKIPKTAPVAMTPGRGYLLVGGEPVLVQTMSPTPGGECGDRT